MQRDYLLSLIKELVAIGSVTESAEESVPGEFIYSRLSRLPYFKEHTENLKMIDTPLEGSPHRLKALIARVDAERRTNKTVLLIGHYDVVSPACYGELAQYAFDCDALGAIFNADADTLYGRGTMDMKCGDAIETALIEEFAQNRRMFDVNLVMCLVGDEENSNSGIIGAVPELVRMKQAGTEFLCAINTEPGEAGDSGVPGPRIFTGTLGKVMPAFYVHGRAAHVANFYDGFSAAAVTARIVSDAEANPGLADSGYPSWTCLDMKVLRDGYSVTVTDKAYAYFNCFAAKNSPEQVMEQMKKIAHLAVIEAEEQLVDSRNALDAAGYKGSRFKPFEPSVITYGELKAEAEKKDPDFGDKLKAFADALPCGDMRDRALKIVDFTAECAAIDSPYVACFFLPPWLPQCSDAPDSKAMQAARKIQQLCLDMCGKSMKHVPLFGGLCDLSYVGAVINDGDKDALCGNMPGWGQIYSLPIDEMRQLELPVLNLGPSGEAPHRRDERLYLKYSLEVLPSLLIAAVHEFEE